MRLPTDNSSTDWRRVSVRFSLPPHTHTIHSDKEEKVDVQKSYDAPCYPRGKKGNHNIFLMASALCPLQTKTKVVIQVLVTKGQQF